MALLVPPVGSLPLPSIGAGELGAIAPMTPMTGASGATDAAGALGTAPARSFASVLEQVVTDAASRAEHAEAMASDFAAGRSGDLHGTMIALEEANVSLRFVGSVRAKLLDAYHELWRTAV